MEPALARAEGEVAWKGWLLPDGDALVSTDDGAAAEALNVARDVLPLRVAGPLVLLVSSEGLAGLFERAPDLMAVRATTTTLNRVHRAIDLSKFAFVPRPLEAIGDIERDALALSAETRTIDAASASGLIDRWNALSRRFEALIDAIRSIAA